jgi:hypothetical protein
MFVEIFIFLITLLLIYLIYVTRAQKHFEKFGIPTPPITFPIGNSPFLHLDILLLRKNLVDICREQYDCLKV